MSESSTTSKQNSKTCSDKGNKSIEPCDVKSRTDAFDDAGNEKNTRILQKFERYKHVR